MSSQPNPIAGTGSSAESIVPSGELEPEGIAPASGVQAGDEIVPAGGEEIPPKPGEGQPEPGKEDGRVIPQWMRALKETNPEAYQKAKTDLFELRDRRSVHPTTQAAREEHDLIQSLGGQQGIATLREDATFFKSAANQFLKGDPAFVDDLWQEDPIAAALHVQPMLDHYLKSDLEGYKSTLAKMWSSEFQNVGFGPGLKSLVDCLVAKDLEGAKGVAESIQKWYESIEQVARKAEDPRVKSLLAERAKRQDAQQQTEKEGFLKTYRTEAINTVVDEGAKVFDSFFKGRKIDKEDRDDLLREALAIANRAVAADKSFCDQRDKHLEAGDSHSALQLTKSRYSRELPDAVKRVARRYGLVSGAPAQTQRTTQQAPGAKVEAGWTVVNVRPEREQIDYGRTTPDMIIAGRAILHDGKKVDWSALKKQGK